MKSIEIKRILVLFFVLLAMFSCKEEEDPVKPIIQKISKIEGYITESGSGRAIPHVFIYTENSSHTVTSDIDGYYEISNINPGKYKLFAKKERYENAEISISVDSGYTTNADFVMRLKRAPGKIEGKVTSSADGEALEGVLVITDPYSSSSSTDKFGNYLLANVPSDIQYKILFSKSGFERKSLVLTAVDSTLKVNVSLDPTFGIIEGKVTDAITGKGLDIVSIVTEPATSSVSTDENGSFRIENVPKLSASSEYKVTAMKSGYKETSVNIRLIPGKTVTANIIMAKERNKD